MFPVLNKIKCWTEKDLNSQQMFCDTKKKNVLLYKEMFCDTRTRVGTNRLFPFPAFVRMTWLPSWSHELMDHLVRSHCWRWRQDEMMMMMNLCPDFSFSDSRLVWKMEQFGGSAGKQFDPLTSKMGNSSCSFPQPDLCSWQSKYRYEKGNHQLILLVIPLY